MTLSEGKIDKSYTILNIGLDIKIVRRLEALGMTDRTKIVIMNKKRNGAVIFSVRGTRLAVGKIIADGINIE